MIIALGLAVNDALIELLNLLIISLAFQLCLLEHHVGLIKLQLELTEAAIRCKLSLLSDLIVLHIDLILQAVDHIILALLLRFHLLYHLL